MSSTVLPYLVYFVNCSHFIPLCVFPILIPLSRFISPSLKVIDSPASMSSRMLLGAVPSKPPLQHTLWHSSNDAINSSSIPTNISSIGNTSALTAIANDAALASLPLVQSVPLFAVILLGCVLFRRIYIENTGAVTAITNDLASASLPPARSVPLLAAILVG